MKLKNILYTGVALMSLTACSDYLDVEAPSSYTEDFIFTQESEIERALNGVYAQAIVNNLYGNAYQRTFILNSDVDMQINSSASASKNSYARFDCTDQGSEISSFWTAAYSLIEYCNKFIHSTENSSLYDKSNGTIMQYVGEAKCLRAMIYHDLVVMFGDVPFDFNPASMRDVTVAIPVKDRLAIQDSLIADLKEASKYMKSTNSVTVERCSKEFAQGMIARIALTAGGYSLRPDKSNIKNYGTMERPENYQEYYKIARDYADSVITAGNHKLSQGFQEVFVNECNYKVVNNDDPIFEIPFAKNASGNTGYIQGPTYSAYESKTVGSWGACSGNGRLNAFYRFLFRDNDVRREEVNGLWYYSYYTNSEGNLADSVYIRNDYTVHNNKWSKLWTDESNTLGNDVTGSTGINYPYLRYADVLLMYAEADNELTATPSSKAIDCLRQVHKRAFPTVEDGDEAFITEASAGKEAFQKAVMNERKWEFAGENSRWRDLVRTNTYSTELVYSFLRYYSAGVQAVGSTTGYEAAINNHDGSEYIENLPQRIYFHAYNVTEPITVVAKKLAKAQFYGYTISGTGLNLDFSIKYPNQSMKSLRIYNAYASAKSQPAKSLISNYGMSAASWNYADFYQWGDENTGTPKDQCKYSFYGYIRSDDGGSIWVVKDGSLTQLSDDFSANTLPVVRYILPYPSTVIQRSNNVYKNYYGY